MTPTPGKAFLAVLCAAAIVAGCSVTVQRAVDPEKLEREIADSLSEDTGAKVNVTCPADIEDEVGQAFTCRATTPGPSGDIDFDVKVTQTEEGGTFEWNAELPS